LIVLSLYLDGITSANEEPISVTFRGRDFSAGFVLMLPYGEWEAMDRPRALNFVASPQALGVRATGEITGVLASRRGG
jgi:hypothetical protein